MSTVKAHDTTSDALREQVAAYRRMSGAERVQIAAEMSEEAREVTAAGVRHRHPDWSDARVHRTVLIRAYGAKLVDPPPGDPDLLSRTGHPDRRFEDIRARIRDRPGLVDLARRHTNELRKIRSADPHVLAPSWLTVLADSAWALREP